MYKHAREKKRMRLPLSTIQTSQKKLLAPHAVRKRHRAVMEKVLLFERRQWTKVTDPKEQGRI